MSRQRQTGQARFKVIDAMDAPFVGRLIRLRIQEGPAPRVRDLRGARLSAESPEGKRETLRVVGFAATGGRPTDARLARTGRVDLVVCSEPGGERPSVATRWTVTGPV
jgi:hypothetical protein